MVAKTGALLNPSIQERNAAILFSPNSVEVFSAVFDVEDSPVILRAFNITTESAKLYMVAEGNNNIREPVMLGGVETLLSATNNVVIVSETGRYQLEFIGALGSSTVTRNVQAV